METNVAGVLAGPPCPGATAFLRVADRAGFGAKQGWTAVARGTAVGKKGYDEDAVGSDEAVAVVGVDSGPGMQNLARIAGCWKVVAKTERWVK